MKCKGKLNWPACLIWRYVVKESGSIAAHVLKLVTGHGGVIGSLEDPSTHWIWAHAGTDLVWTVARRKISACQEEKSDCPGSSLVTIL